MLRLRIPILFGHSEVHNMDDILSLAGYLADQEVVGFDVPVDEVLFVDRLDTGKLCEVVSKSAALQHESRGLLAGNGSPFALPP